MDETSEKKDSTVTRTGSGNPVIVKSTVTTWEKFTAIVNHAKQKLTELVSQEKKDPESKLLLLRSVEELHHRLTENEIQLKLLREKIEERKEFELFAIVEGVLDLMNKKIERYKKATGIKGNIDPGGLAQRVKAVEKSFGWVEKVKEWSRYCHYNHDKSDEIIQSSILYTMSEFVEGELELLESYKNQRLDECLVEAKRKKAILKELDRRLQFVYEGLEKKKRVLVALPSPLRMPWRSNFEEVFDDAHNHYTEAGFKIIEEYFHSFYPAMQESLDLFIEGVDG